MRERQTETARKVAKLIWHDADTLFDYEINTIKFGLIDEQ